MTEIEITHTIDVDKCIAKEIKELNNDHNILTLYSCCGHEKGSHGYIVVHEFDKELLIELGYKQNGWLEPGSRPHMTKYPTFETKSVCKGRC